MWTNRCENDFDILLIICSEASDHCYIFLDEIHNKKWTYVLTYNNKIDAENKKKWCKMIV